MGVPLSIPTDSRIRPSQVNDAVSPGQFARWMGSWIHTLNTELKAGIDDTVRNNPLTEALFGVAQSMMPAAQARYAVQRFDERYSLVKHQNS